MGVVSLTLGGVPHLLLVFEVALPRIVSFNPYSFYLCNIVRPVIFKVFYASLVL